MIRVMVKSENFKNAAVRSGFAISDLADKVGVTRQNLYSSLRNDSGLSPRVAKKISEALGKEFDELFEIIHK